MAQRLRPRRIGLGRLRWRPDLLGGLGLAALIGLPGLGLYVVAPDSRLSASVEPAELYDTWWRVPVLLIAAFANGWAEEIIVVAYLLPGCSSSGEPGRRMLVVQPAARGYHLYQGFGAGLGNIVMGLVFGYVGGAPADCGR